MAMFFGLCNSPATFQQFMNELFKDLITEGWLVVYMDDLPMSSPDSETDTLQTTRVLQRMKELDLHLKIKKCKFGVFQINYLGMVLSPGQIKMDQTELNGIKQWPTPKMVKDVISFMGFTNFYRKFNGNHLNIASLLINLTKKNKPWNWNDACENTFNQLKNIFMKELVLQLPNLTKPFTITADASKYVSEGVLLQKDINGEWHPCSYLSQLFGPAE